ncbi:solute carrier family 2, facilitated glucose transporter member 8-like isoform X1 [Dermacentor variabilis]|uniref:solute carrier family 2, facilitated glucose transporter member 8-like isoform X1 n=1 Tax=Dermacentor variabilis TaxID=34621 RepID=UPI003F5B0AE3
MEAPPSPRPPASPAMSIGPPLGRRPWCSSSSAGQLSPVHSPASTPCRGDAESAEVHTNDQGPVTLFSSLMAGWMGALSMGTSIGYSLPAGQSLIHARSNGTRSGDEKLFWFDSLLPLAAMFGSLWGCCLAFWLGRRCAMAIGSLGSLCAWLALGWASTDSWILYTARFVEGAATGVTSIIAPAYVAEIATAKDRGKQCGTVQTAIAAGVLYTYVLGRFTDWPQLALCCAVPSAVSALLAVRAIESPRWLMEQGKQDASQASLRRLRFITSQADGEMEAIEVIYVKSPTPVRHYMLAVMIIVLQQFSGVNMIMHYAAGPLRTTSTSSSPDLYIILASVQVVTTALACRLLDMVGRIKPLAVSVTVCSCSMMALGSIFFAFSNADGNVDSGPGFYLTDACKVVFCIGYSIGLGPAAWVLATELAPLRGCGSDFGSVCVFHWASALAVVSLVSTVGLSAPWLAVLTCLAAVSTFAGGLAAVFLLPDTSCVSLETILLEGHKDRPKKPLAPVEFTASSTNQQGERGKEHELRKVADFGHQNAFAPTAKPTPRSPLHWERAHPRAHNLHADGHAKQDPHEATMSPKNEGGAAPKPDKAAAATVPSKQ